MAELNKLYDAILNGDAKGAVAVTRQARWLKARNRRGSSLTTWFWPPAP